MNPARSAAAGARISWRATPYVARMMDVRPLPISPALSSAALGVAALLALAASPGVLPAEAGRAVHGGFGWLCHQIPERSPHLGGVPWALCHRCVGILAGVLAGLVVAPVLPARALAVLAHLRPGRVVVLALVPLAVDWSLGAFGVWANTPVSRLATGAVFGAAAGLVLALALRPAAPAPSSPNLLAS